MRAWFLPTFLACVAHGALSLLPVDFGSKPKPKPKTDVTFALQQMPTPPPSPEEAVVAAPQPPRKTKRRISPEPPPVEPEPDVLEPETELEEPEEEKAKAILDTPLKGQAKPEFDLRAYGQKIYGLVVKHRRYPVVARRLGLEGKVLIQISIQRSGALGDEPLVYHTSGEEVLDKEALRMVKVAAPFLPLPDEFEKNSATLVIPVHFRLRD